MKIRLVAMPLRFWRSANGREPVREWLRVMPAGDRAVIGNDMRRVQYGWPVGMPLVRNLNGGLWELRCSLPSRREARVIFVVGGEVIVALHGFIKKTQKTPSAEIALARRRLKEMIA
jgi:phage-related protein